MDRIDRLQAQLDALAQQTAHWQHQTRTLARHLRWWDKNGCPRFDPFHPSYCPNIYSH